VSGSKLHDPNTLNTFGPKEPLQSRTLTQTHEGQEPVTKPRTRPFEVTGPWQFFDLFIWFKTNFYHMV